MHIICIYIGQNHPVKCSSLLYFGYTTPWRIHHQRIGKKSFYHMITCVNWMGLKLQENLFHCHNHLTWCGLKLLRYV